MAAEEIQERSVKEKNIIFTSKEGRLSLLHHRALLMT